MTEDPSTTTPAGTPAKKAAAKKTAASTTAASTTAASKTAAKKTTAKKTTTKKVAAKKAAPAKKAAAKKTAAALPPTESPGVDTVDLMPIDSPAPAKRAARQRAAARATEALPAVDTPSVDVSPESPSTGASRSRTRRDSASAPAALPDGSAPATADATATDAAPAAPAGRRRGRAAAAANFSAVDETSDAVAEPTDVDPAGPRESGRSRTRAPRASAAPFAVVFQPPAAEAAAPASRSRRRGAPEGAALDVPLVDDEELTEEELAAHAESDGAAHAESDAAADADAAADEAAGEDDAEDDSAEAVARRRRRRGRRGRGRARTEGDGDDAAPRDEDAAGADVHAAAEDLHGAAAAVGPDAPPSDDADGDEDSASGTRRRRRRRSRSGTGVDAPADDPPNTVVRVRQPRQTTNGDDEVRGIAGSTRMAAKQQRRREGREQGRRRPPILTEAEFLARREAVDRIMVIRQTAERTQIAVLEDGILVEHYVTRADAVSYVGNVYLGRVQNVLPSMEAAFIDISKGRNGVLYAGEVNYDASQFDGRPHRIESALKSGQSVLVQVTKDPIGHKGARLTSQVSLPGRYLVYVPEGSMTGISRKLPENERNRLKSILKKVVPEEAGVIVRTAAEGASEEELTRDIARLQAQWSSIMDKAQKASGGPTLLYGEPDLVIRVVRDIFNEDFTKLVVAGRNEWELVEQYVETFAPELRERVEQWTSTEDVFAAHRVDEQLIKALDRKVYLPSGGSLVIDRTEAMVVVDVNTGKFVGKGGNLEETVTKNNIEAAEEIVRQLRLRDLGGIIVIDFIDMVLESNRELVLRRLIECLGRDRTKHQVAEVTSLGLVQMTRKRVGQGLLEAFSETCEVCNGRGIIVSLDPTVPGAPGNGRGAKTEHRHDSPTPRGDKGRDGNGSRPDGGGGRPDKGRTPKPAPPLTLPTVAAEAVPDGDGAPAPVPEASEGGRRRRGRRGGGGNGESTSPDAVVANEDAPAAGPGTPAMRSQPEGARTSLAVVDEALDIDTDGATSSKRPARRRRKAAATSAK